MAVCYVGVGQPGLRTPILCRSRFDTGSDATQGGGHVPFRPDDGQILQAGTVPPYLHRGEIRDEVLRLSAGGSRATGWLRKGAAVGGRYCSEAQWTMGMKMRHLTLVVLMLLLV